jgi:hypothetical protein
LVSAIWENWVTSFLAGSAVLTTGSWGGVSPWVQAIALISNEPMIRAKIHFLLGFIFAFLSK